MKNNNTTAAVSVGDPWQELYGSGFSFYELLFFCDN